MSPARGVLACLAVIAVLCVAHVHLRYVVTGSIHYDDAHNANVAKNVAFGSGYSTSYHEVIHFNPEASTGPAILLPAAALVRIFGNKHWVPNLAIVLMIWGTLTLCLVLLIPYLTETEWFAATALMAVVVALFPDEIGLLGEVPGTLFGCASILLVCRASDRRWPLFTAGILLGLAIQSKLLMALMLPPALLHLLISPVTGTNPRPRWRTAAIFLLGAMIPSIAWEAWQAGALQVSWPDLVALKLGQYGFFARWSGIGELQGAHSLGQLLLDKAARNGAFVLEYFGGWRSVILASSGLAVSLVALARTASGDGSPRPHGAILVLLGAASLHFVWWLLLSREGWYRHLLPGTLYLAIAVSVATVVAWRWSRLAGSFALVALLVSWMPLAAERAPMFRADYRVQPRVTSMLAARDEVMRLRQNPDLLFVGYGWWAPRDLEYLLPSVGNFKDVLRLRADEVRGRKIVLVRNEFFNWEKSAALAAFQKACDEHTIFRRDPFVLSECPGVWKLTFPWAETEPQRVREDHPFAAVDAPGGRPATLAHATSALAFPVADPLRRVTVGFGLLDGAWREGDTDGVEFRISVVGSAGTTLLWRRFVDPVANTADRGQLTATIMVPETIQGWQVVAETRPGRTGDSKWDWAFWSTIELR